MATRLTEKLLQFIYSALNKSPEQFVAFRAQHSSGTFRFTIQNYVLTCYANNAVIFTTDLGQHTLLSLAQSIGSLNGMSIVYRSDAEVMALSARVLMDGSGAQVESNGDCFYAYSSVLWMYLESVGKELSTANDEIANMLDQMNLKTADGYWLDYWGSEHYGIFRIAGESDADYSNRIIVEILRPRGNNKAIEAALTERFSQKAVVKDAPQYRNQVNTFNGFYSHNGSRYYNGTADLYYGLFEVVMAYDLLGGSSPNAFAADIRVFVEKFRDAGTQLQSLNLSGAVITDQLPFAVTDSHALSLVASLSDAFVAPSESASIMPVYMATLMDTADPAVDVPLCNVTSSTIYDSQRKFNGLVRHQSGVALSESWN